MTRSACFARLDFKLNTEAESREVESLKNLKSPPFHIISHVFVVAVVMMVTF